MTSNRGRKHEPQRGEVRRLRPARYPLPGEGEVACPVCHYPATRLTAPDQSPSRYAHAYRLFPCRSDWVALPLQELLDVANANARSW